MKKRKALRLGGFIVAACATTALAATAVQSTGAWFSDSSSGSITSSSGHMKLDVWDHGSWQSDVSDLSLSYNDLVPGKNVEQSISYKVDASSGASASLWLVFPPDSTFDPSQTITDPNTHKVSQGSGYQLFTGGNPATLPAGIDNGSGLGRYGYFKVADSHPNTGVAFRSGNLAFHDATNTPNSVTSSGKSDSCATDPTNGRGGSDWIATDANQGINGDANGPFAYCGVPRAILLSWGMTNNASGTVTITFGLDGFKQTEQNQPEATVPFKLVLTQDGHAPLDLSKYPL